MRTWIAAFGVVPLATATFGILYQLGARGGPRSANPWVLGFLAAWAAIGLVAGARSAMVAVLATPDALIIRNFLSTRRIPWADVISIERPRPWVYERSYAVFANWGNGLQVRLRDGSTVISSAYAPAGGDPADFADGVIQDLRQQVAQTFPNSPWVDGRAGVVRRKRTVKHRRC
ncbi:hypothetical protein GCM10009682_00850 [Luedemannella flava]|uniref:Low molecular weight protein antigen 6 PH domain-containing protein n=1 Tax=Luedemannella flava TaxID=349316 RepID=A0ABN2LC85_9ACTN